MMTSFFLHYYVRLTVMSWNDTWLDSFERIIFRRVRNIAKCNYYLRHVSKPVCLSFRVEQLGSH